MNITAFYAAILAIVFITLSIRTIQLRRGFKTAIGHGNHPQLERAMRAHANFAEYVPYTLLLLAMFESMSHLNILIHLLGITLVIGRTIHAYNISQVNEIIRFRVIGMTMTFAVIAIAATGILISFLLQRLS